MKSVIVLLPWLLIISTCTGYRILAILPLNVRSHFNMYEELLKTLARKGHQVDVYSPFKLEKPIPNYNEVYTFPGPRTFLNNFTYDEIMELLGIGTVGNLVGLGGDMLCPFLAEPELQHLAKNPPSDPPYDAIILELFGAPCFYIFGHFLNIPIITVSSSSLYSWGNDDIANPENLAFVSNNMLAHPQNMNFWQRVKNFVATVGMKLIYKTATARQDEIIRKVFGEGLPSIRELERQTSMILANTHMSITGNQPNTAAYIEVGGLHVWDVDRQLSPSLEKWLNESTDGFLYFTFGSMALLETFPREKLEIFYKSLAKLAPIRVLMKVAYPSLLPPGLPKNIRTESWMPQIRILKHRNIKAFITHGGLMGTQEAIYCGVPLIAMPLFVDQFGNVENYVAKKIAVKLDFPSLTLEDFDAALNAVLNDPIYRNSMKQISKKFRDRPMSPGDTAVYWIEYVIKYGRDTLRSPAMDLTWWQVALLDVYLFVFLVTVAILIVIAIAIRFLVNLISAARKGTSRAKKND